MNSLKSFIPSKEPTYLVIDIRDVLKDYSRQTRLYDIYKHFPLQEIVQCLLSVNAYEDNGEYFWNELEQRFDKNNMQDQVDWDFLSLFHELLCSYLDEYIRIKVPPVIDIHNYVFHRWLSETTVMLQKDDNARSSHCSM